MRVTHSWGQCYVSILSGGNTIHMDLKMTIGDIEPSIKLETHVILIETSERSASPKAI